MSLTRTLVAATVAASLALAPALAEARAGSKSSGGSKGSKTTTTAPSTTYPSNNLSGSSSGSTSSTPVYPTPQKAPQSAVSGGQALPPPSSTTTNSSVNPQGATPAAPSTAAPATSAAPSTAGTSSTATGAMGAPRVGTAAPPAPAAQPSFMQRNPLLTGIAGGLLGATIANSLFGNHAEAAPAQGTETGSLIGTVLKWALILGAVALVVSMFRRLMRPAVNGPAEPSFRMGPPSANPGEPRIAVPQAGAAAAAPPVTDIAKRIAGPDYDAFTQILTGLQNAWSAGDIGAMARWATPEMQRFFAAELSRNEARGFVNHIEDVELVAGDVVEAWSEGHTEFCTARVTFAARDYDVAIGKQRGEPGWIVDGDPNRKVEATEIWTFARQPGQAWQLSAIEQTETV